MQCFSDRRGRRSLQDYSSTRGSKGLLQERISKQPISEESEIPTRRVALVSSLLDRVRYAQDDGDGGSLSVGDDVDEEESLT